MPPQDRLRFDNQQRLLPRMQPARKQDEDGSIAVGQARVFDAADEDNKLLPERSVFDDQLCLAAR